MASSALPGIPGYDPDNLQPWTVAVVVSVTGLSVATVILRLVSRHIKAHQLWWDDYMIIFSQLWNFLTVGFIFAMYASGMGIHADKVPFDQIVMTAKYLVVAEILYVYNLVWTKISILLMYYRIFRFPFFKKMAYGIGGFVVAWVITIMFLFIFICVPVEKLWYTDLPGHCIDQVGTWIANAASTIATDIAILVMPIPQVWKLQLRKAQKIGVTIAFCLGFFVVFASAYRFRVLFTYSPADPTYSLAPTVGWTAIEMSAGIISANLPTIGPVMAMAGRKIGIKGSLLSASGTRGTGNGGTSTNASKLHLSSANHHRHKAANSRSEAVLPGQKPTKKGSTGTFYRLSDDIVSVGGSPNGSGETAVVGGGGGGADARLRPDDHHHTYAYTVTGGGGTKKGDGESSLSGDEIPLHGIRVHTDFKQVAD